jgi:hypothetical protein
MGVLSLSGIRPMLFDLLPAVLPAAIIPEVVDDLVTVSGRAPVAGPYELVRDLLFVARHQRRQARDGNVAIGQRSVALDQPGYVEPVGAVRQAPKVFVGRIG